MVAHGDGEEGEGDQPVSSTILALQLYASMSSLHALGSPFHSTTYQAGSASGSNLTDHIFTWGAESMNFGVGLLFAESLAPALVNARQLT
jgi:hypothetical protein